jgi:hypothetical protein
VVEPALAELLASLDPVLNDGTFVFGSVRSAPVGVPAVVTVREDEGTTLVVAGDDANRRGHPANVVAGFHHDHVFVPVDRGADAVLVLAALSKDGLRIVAEGDV